MKKIIFTFTLLYCASAVFCQVGLPDSSFGTDGKVLVPFSNGLAFSINNGFTQADNKIVSVGEMTTDSGNNFVAIRYNSDGSLDSLFGNHGTATVSFNVDFAEAFTGGAQSDGKIILAGYGSTGFVTPVVSGLIARLNTDGTIDNSFGDTGRIYKRNGDFTSFKTLLIQADDKIVVGGTVRGLSGIFSRYLPNGQPDLEFGTGGSIVQYDINPMSSTSKSDGSLLFGGINQTTGSATKATFFQCLSNGDSDSSFGENGMLTVSGYNIYGNSINSVKVDRQNRIVAGEGIGTSPSNHQWYVIRLLANGNYDATFGKQGIDSIYVPDSAVGISAIDLEKNDEILLFGGIVKTGRSNSNFFLGRLQEGGLFDSTFGSYGHTVTDFSYLDYTVAGFVQPNGRIIQLGESHDNKSDTIFNAIACYNNDDISKKQILITKIKRWIQHHNGIEWNNIPGTQSYAVQRSIDGQHWTTINRQAVSSGEQFAVNHYSDPTPPSSGTTYYRLQTTSTSNAVANSNVIAITNDELNVSLSPNPAKSTLSIAGLPTNQKVKITVVDFSGNIKMQTTVNNNTYTLNIASLPSGNYVLKVETSTNSVTKQFVKE